MPAIGFHSVMLRPDSVRRVMPPTTITAKTNPAEPISHPPTPGDDKTGSWFVSCVALAFEEKNRGSKRVAQREVGAAAEDVGIWDCDSAE